MGIGERVPSAYLRLLIALLAVLALWLPQTASAANSFGSAMFGISTGGTIQNQNSKTVDRDLTSVRNVGSKWVRIDINWDQIQAQGPTSYNWGPIDRVVQAATSRGINVLGIIVYTPSWARPPGTNGHHPPDPNQYATFAAAAVRHYAAMGVHTYEVWNEANAPRFWQPRPDPAAYTQLLKAAYPAIKGADPQATVLTAGSAPAWDSSIYSPIDFLAGIYANGGGDSFDAVAHHPYCWPSLPGGVNCTAWQQMHATSPSLRSVMAENGDGDKRIWATEFGAPTNGPFSVTEDRQAQIIKRAYTYWSTYDWGGPLFTYTIRDHGTATWTNENFFGLLRNDYSKKPSYSAYQRQVAQAGG
jgi:hypothetical protein